MLEGYTNKAGLLWLIAVEQFPTNFACSRMSTGHPVLLQQEDDQSQHLG
jgi:hypothetical protein